MIRFDFATPSRIVFGDGVSAELPALVREAIRATSARVRAAVVVGSAPKRSAGIRGALAAAGFDVTVLQAVGEPSVGSVRDGAARLRASRPEVVIAVGGGSVIDAAKAVAALAANPGDVLDYLEVVGRGLPLPNPSLPVIAVPTTAGTGSEVTRNAVLTSFEHKVKVSLRSDSMLPKLAVVDPLLTRDLPPEVTAVSGLDALTQLIEPFVSPFANPITDLFVRDGLVRAARSLRRAVEVGDGDSRRDMSLASLFGGIALANAKLGAVHGIAGVVGGMVDAPHGGVCARLLPEVIEANAAALAERSPSSAAVGRYAEVARILTGRADAGATNAADWVRELADAVGVRPLSAYGLGPEHVDAVVEGALRASSTRGNPVELTAEELAVAVRAAL